MQEENISPLAFHNLKNLNIEVSAFTQPDMTYDGFGSGDDELAAPPVTGLEVQVTTKLNIIVLYINILHE